MTTAKNVVLCYYREISQLSILQLSLRYFTFLHNVFPFESGFGQNYNSAQQPNQPNQPNQPHDPV